MPARNIDVLLHEVMRVPDSDIAGYSAPDRDITGAIVDQAGRFSTEVFEPLNAVGDREGCRLVDGRVFTPTGSAEAFDRLDDDEWCAIACAPEHGGQGLPNRIGTVVGEIWVSGNMALNMCQGLTQGAYATIEADGSRQQTALHLPRLGSCEWTGTMNLTEAGAGTDLGLLRTRAQPQADTSYPITATQIFISAGDHDLAEYISHLVLARIHGNATCEVVCDGATGDLLGEEHLALTAMFTMMNEARLAVGAQGLGLTSAAKQ